MIPECKENASVTHYRVRFFKDGVDLEEGPAYDIVEFESRDEAVESAEFSMDDLGPDCDYAIIEKVVVTPVARVISERVTTVEEL